MSDFEANVICGNCGQVNVICAEAGMNVKSILREVSKICSNCKCRISYDNYNIQHKPL